MARVSTYSKRESANTCLVTSCGGGLAYARRSVGTVTFIPRLCVCCSVSLDFIGAAREDRLRIEGFVADAATARR